MFCIVCLEFFIKSNWPVPCKINKDTTKATYRNGVLDIAVDREKAKKKRGGKKIKIE